MRKYNKNIAVTVNTFSKNEFLVNELKKYFTDVTTTTNRYSPEQLIDVLKKSDGAIVGLDEINENVLKYCNNLKIISKFGVGMDNIKLDDCKKYNVQVRCEQGVNKRAVAELTLGFMLSLTRNIYLTSNQLKNENWNKNGGFSLSEKTIGIIGVGNVGKDLVHLLKPFNCNILVNDIKYDEEQLNFYKNNKLVNSSKPYIYRNSDIITIHTPLNSDTKNMINEKTISLMKPNAFLINTARGEIVNYDDLYNALITKKIAGAAIDVYYEEPPKCKPLISLENVICTPHIGGNSKEAVLAMGYSSINNLLEYFKNEK